MSLSNNFIDEADRERKVLTDIIQNTHDAKALRKMLERIVALPRFNVFGSVVVPSNGILQAITGRSGNPDDNRSGLKWYMVHYIIDKTGRATSQATLASSEFDAHKRAVDRAIRSDAPARQDSVKVFPFVAKPGAMRGIG